MAVPHRISTSLGRLRRIRRLGAALALASILAACSTTRDTGPTPATGGQAGTSQTQAQSSLAQVADVPIPTNSNLDLDQSIILGDRDTWSGRLVISTPHRMADMFDFYRQQMPAFGWTELSVVRSAVSLLTYTRDNRVATVQIAPARLDASRINFIVAPRRAATDRAQPAR